MEWKLGEQESGAGIDAFDEWGTLYRKDHRTPRTSTPHLFIKQIVQIAKQIDGDGVRPRRFYVKRRTIGKWKK